MNINFMKRYFKLVYSENPESLLSERQSLKQAYYRRELDRIESEFLETLPPEAKNACVRYEEQCNEFIEKLQHLNMKAAYMRSVKDCIKTF